MQSITADFSPIIHCFHKIHAAFGGYPSSGDHPLGLEYWGLKSLVEANVQTSRMNLK